MASYRLVAQSERETNEVVRVNGFEVGIRDFGSESCQRLQGLLNKEPHGELAQAILTAGQMSRSRKTGHGYIVAAHTGLLVPQSDWGEGCPGTSDEFVPLSGAALAQLNQCRGIRALESSSLRSRAQAGDFEIPVSEVKNAFRAGAIQFEQGEPLIFPLHMTMCEGGHWKREDDKEVVLTNWPDWDAGEKFLVGRYEEEGESRILVLEPATKPGDWIAYAIQEKPSFQIWAGVDHSVVPPKPYRNDRVEIRTFPVGNTLTGWAPIPVRFHRTS